MAGIVRKVDALGRIVIPKEMRRILNIQLGDPIEIINDGKQILLRKFDTDSSINKLLKGIKTQVGVANYSPEDQNRILTLLSSLEHAINDAEIAE